MKALRICLGLLLIAGMSWAQYTDLDRCGGRATGHAGAGVDGIHRESGRHGHGYRR